MAALDPLCILNSDTQVGPDGVARRANEKVTRNYMQFGKYFVSLVELDEHASFEIRRQENYDKPQDIIEENNLLNETKNKKKIISRQS